MGKLCASCGVNMPTRDNHDDCVGCLGVDHAVLAANAAGDCEVCAALPKSAKDARLHLVHLVQAREACEVAEQHGAEVLREADGELPYEEDPIPAKTHAIARGAFPHHPPPQQDEEWEEYGDDAGEEDPLYGDYSPKFAAIVRAEMRYKRERKVGAAQAADPALEPAATARPRRRELWSPRCSESYETDGAKDAGTSSLPPMNRRVAAHPLRRDVPRDKEPTFIRKPSYGRPSAPRQGPTGAMRPEPPAERQPDNSERRPEKRRFPLPDAPPPFRGRGRGRGTRGSSAGRSAK